jgi:hypothetical protein
MILGLDVTQMVNRLSVSARPTESTTYRRPRLLCSKRFEVCSFTCVQASQLRTNCSGAPWFFAPIESSVGASNSNVCLTAHSNVRVSSATCLPSAELRRLGRGSIGPKMAADIRAQVRSLTPSISSCRLSSFPMRARSTKPRPRC